MIDHTSFCVKDYQQSLDFYDRTLLLLGYERLMAFDIPEGKLAGYGIKERTRPGFWISSVGNEAENIGRARGLHVTFVAPTVTAVHQWHQACLDNGGTCNGAPGPRPLYHPGYYGAFVIDPNGWRIEACLHDYSASG